MAFEGALNRVRDKDSGPAAEPSAQLMETLIERLGRHARAAAVFGEPVSSAGVTIVPVARAGFAFGGGLGRGSGDSQVSEGGGGGGGVEVRPMGFIEIRDGAAHYRPIPDLRRDIALSLAGIAASLLAPRLLSAGRRLYRARRG